MPRYRSMRVEPTEDARSSVYPAAAYEEAPSYAFGQGAGEAIPLEEYDFGSYNPSEVRPSGTQREAPGNHAAGRVRRV